VVRPAGWNEWSGEPWSNPDALVLLWCSEACVEGCDRAVRVLACTAGRPVLRYFDIYDEDSTIVIARECEARGLGRVVILDHPDVATDGVHVWIGRVRLSRADSEMLANHILAALGVAPGHRVAVGFLPELNAQWHRATEASIETIETPITSFITPKEPR
jgi:hypothetical protein